MDIIENYFALERNRINEEINRYEESVDFERKEEQINYLKEHLKVLEYEYRVFLVKIRQDRVDELENQINTRDFGWDLTEEQVKNHIARNEHEIDVLKSEIDKFKEEMSSIKGEIVLDDYDFDKVQKQIKKSKKLFEIDSKIVGLKAELEELDGKYKDGGLIPVLDLQKMEELRKKIRGLENEKAELEGRSMASPEPEPGPKVDPIPEPVPEPGPKVDPIPEPEPEPGPKVDPIPEPVPEPGPKVDPIPEPVPESGPRVIPDPKPKRVERIKKWIRDNKKALIIAGIAALSIGTLVFALNIGPAIAAGKMVSNAAAWHGASAVTQAGLHANNVALSSSLAKAFGTASFASNTGIWTFNGVQLATVAAKAAGTVLASASAMGVGAGLLTAGIKAASPEYKKYKKEISSLSEEFRAALKDDSLTDEELYDLVRNILLDLDSIVEEIETNDKMSTREKNNLLKRVRKLKLNIGKSGILIDDYGDEHDREHEEDEEHDRDHDRDREEAHDRDEEEHENSNVMGMYGKTTNMSYNEAQRVISQIKDGNLLYAFDPVDEKEDYERVHNLWQEAVATLSKSLYGKKNVNLNDKNLNEHDRNMNKARYYGSQEINQQDGAFDQFATAIYDLADPVVESQGRGR